MSLRFANVALETLVAVDPPEEITSAEVEARLDPLYRRVGLAAGRLELMTGIRARRFWPQAVAPSWAAAQAGAAALAQSRIPRERIGALAHCGVCRDQLEPATAAPVHRALALPPTCQVLDLSNACLGVVNGFVWGGALIEAGLAEAVLLVSGEDGRPLLERTLRQLLEGAHTRQSIKPFFANLTIGAGAVAAVLCHRRLAPDAPRLLAAAVETDTAACELCQGGTAGTAELDMRTDSEALLEAGIACAARGWARFRDVTGWDGGAAPDRVICHQVGRVHERRLFAELGLDPAKSYSTFETHGNTGSVALPLTLAKAAAAGFVRPGHTVALLGIGSGLSSLMAALQW